MAVAFGRGVELVSECAVRLILYDAKVNFLIARGQLDTQILEHLPEQHPQQFEIWILASCGYCTACELWPYCLRPQLGNIFKVKILHLNILHQVLGIYFLWYLLGNWSTSDTRFSWGSGAPLWLTSDTRFEYVLMICDMFCSCSSKQSAFYRKCLIHGALDNAQRAWGRGEREAEREGEKKMHWAKM